MAIGLTGAGPDVAITARDADRLVRFYEDVIGLPLEKRLDWPDHGARVWFFAVGDGHLKIVGLDDPPAAANPPGGNRDATGFRYVTIEVVDIEEVIRAIDGSDGRLQRPVARHASSIVAFVEDPEGNSVEFVQRIESPAV